MYRYISIDIEYPYCKSFWFIGFFFIVFFLCLVIFITLFIYFFSGENTYKYCIRFAFVLMVDPKSIFCVFFCWSLFFGIAWELPYKWNQRLISHIWTLSSIYIYARWGGLYSVVSHPKRNGACIYKIRETWSRILLYRQFKAAPKKLTKHPPN